MFLGYKLIAFLLRFLHAFILREGGECRNTYATRERERECDDTMNGESSCLDKRAETQGKQIRKFEKMAVAPHGQSAVDASSHRSPLATPTMGTVYFILALFNRLTEAHIHDHDSCMTMYLQGRSKATKQQS